MWQVTSGTRGAAFTLLAAVLFCQEAYAQDAIEPGDVQVRPTWSCTGIDWHFTGDANRNASVTVQFRRKGTIRWHRALDLWLHDFERTTMFSGSVFRLAPGTEYEFKLQMHDPDGGSTVRTVTARTLVYPRIPSRVIPVPEGGLVEAQKRALPSAVMLLGPGTYPATTLRKSGRPGEWIVYKAARPGEVVIEGRIRILADYVWLHGLTVRDPVKTIEGSRKGVCITNCRLSGHYTIHTPGGAENYFIADNVLTGDAGGKFTFSGEGVDFGSDRGGGHAVCFNEMTDFADGVSYGGDNIDVYNNYIHETVDDFIEPDYSRANYRAWNNACYNSMCGFSFQPMKGGPWYYFGNLNVGTYLHAFKVKKVTGWSVIYGNTILSKSPGLGGTRSCLRGWILNNVWLRTEPGPLTDFTPFRPEYLPTRFDYNAYGTGGAEPFARIAYKQLAEKYNWDKHSFYVDYRRLFVDPVKPPAGNPHYGRDVHNNLIPRDWWFEHTLLLPRQGSPLIDAGIVLPNLTGPYLGKAPDLGAHERGLGTAWYGPRTWDDQADLVYGVPKGWKKVPVSKAAEYRSLGCPEPKDARVLLVCESPRIFALMRVEPARGEARWKRAEQIVAPDEAALTKVLAFQDGFYARLYRKGGNALLVASRVEPAGVLHVTVGCRERDLPRARLQMFQFVRSLYR